MAPYEALYGRKCRTPLFWTELGESKIFGVDLIKDAEQKVKGLWLEHGIEEATWETESSMKERYPNLFTGKIFGDENFLSGGEL